MRLTIGTWSCAFIIGVAVSGVLLAQQLPRAASKVLLLDNERAVEGEIELRGEFYIVRRAAGEMTIPVNKVLAVCLGMEEAYQLLCSQANLRDSDERLRLARWCQIHGLREQAIAEAKAALQIRPGSQDASQLLTVLQRPTIVAPLEISNEPSAKHSLTPEIEVNGECLSLFANKVQTILMNTCVNCHSGGGGGSFDLTRPTEAAARQALQSNLVSAIKQICFEQPGASPLLHKACSAHGGAEEAALPNRQAPPYAILQSWVELVTARNPQLKSHGSKAVVASSPAPAAKQTREVFGGNGTALPKDPATGLAKANEQVVPSVNPAALAGGATPPTARVIPSEHALSGLSTTPRTMSSTPADNWQPASEFDPMIFNRMWHSGR